MNFRNLFLFLNNILIYMYIFVYGPVNISCTACVIKHHECNEIGRKAQNFVACLSEDEESNRK